MSNQSQAGVALQATNHINGSPQCPELHVSQELSIFYRRQKTVCGGPQSQISSLRPSPPVPHCLQENLIYHAHTPGIFTVMYIYNKVKFDIIHSTASVSLDLYIFIDLE